MKKRASSIDVARRAGVSQATVSYVLRGRSDKSISEDTRARVLQAAEDLGYLPNRLVDGVLRGKTSTVGVLMPDFAHSFNSRLLMGLEEGLAASGYRTLIAHNRNDPELERQQVRMLLEQRVDGLVASTDEATIEHVHEWITDAHKAGVSVVLVDDVRMQGAVDTVATDDVLGARLAVEHLIHQGHRKIVFLGAGERASSSRERREGYLQALAAHGIPVREDWILGSTYRSDRIESILPVMQSVDRPTAAFAVSDGHAANAMTRLRENGVLVPRDLAFVGYGDLEWATYTDLSSVHQNPLQMGHLAAERLVARVEGDMSPSVTIRLQPELVVRGSSSEPIIAK